MQNDSSTGPLLSGQAFDNARRRRAQTGLGSWALRFSTGVVLGMVLMGGAVASNYQAAMSTLRNPNLRDALANAPLMRNMISQNPVMRSMLSGTLMLPEPGDGTMGPNGTRRRLGNNLETNEQQLAASASALERREPVALIYGDNIPQAQLRRVIKSLDLPAEQVFDRRKADVVVRQFTFDGPVGRGGESRVFAALAAVDDADLKLNFSGSQAGTRSSAVSAGFEGGTPGLNSALDRTFGPQPSAVNLPVGSAATDPGVALGSNPGGTGPPPVPPTTGPPPTTPPFTPPFVPPPPNNTEYDPTGQSFGQQAALPGGVQAAALRGSLRRTYQDRRSGARGSNRDSLAPFLLHAGRAEGWLSPRVSVVDAGTTRRLELLVRGGDGSWYTVSQRPETTFRIVGGRGVVQHDQLKDVFCVPMALAPSLNGERVIVEATFAPGDMPAITARAVLIVRTAQIGRN